MLEQTKITDMERYVLDHFDRAMEQRHIKVYCQPVVRAISGQICGMEALSRWEDPEAGLLTPDKFIGVLERHRRIHELDIYVVNRVCEGYHNLLDAGTFVPISINLSRLDYELCDIFEAIESAVVVNRMPRSHLCIEITESALNWNEGVMRRYVERFRAAGYPVWMDDFGSGYSTLNLLKDFRFDELKIDMQFLSDFHTRSKQILASIVDMAKRIGTHTLTEGVETEEEYIFLRNIGCEKLQGSYFGTPLPYMDCLDHARRRGLEWEPPLLRDYYDQVGMANLLSATPFLAQVSPTDGRELNSIPLSLVELRGNDARCLFSNLAFEKVADGVDFEMVFGPFKRHPTPDVVTPLELLSMPLRRILEEARGGAGTGRMHIVFRGEYYQFQARRLAMHDDICCILLRFENLSRGADLERQAALDDGLRQIYAIFDWVTLLDLAAGTITPLYLDSREQVMKLTGALGSILSHYAEEWIFPGDREKFLRFANPDTLVSRARSAGSGALTANLRTRTYHGTFRWKSYVLVQVREAGFYLMCRDVEGEIRELLEERADSRATGGVDLKALWASAVQYCPLKFFWKDRERRFQGASQSFLDYYGFASRDEILGKTDEDMGWHIHPDDYRDVEQDVLQEGEISYSAPGTCIARGESRNILASKLPVYNELGDIVGLFGYFFEAGDENETRWDLGRDARRDTLTGLLNSRGLDEELFAYQDEYELRHTDFVRFDVAIDDLPDINRNFGFDFSDKVIRAVAGALVDRCGTTATVARLAGSQFTVLRQLDGTVSVDKLADAIRAISTDLREVDGIAFNAFLSVGAAAYSETGTPDAQASEAQLRRLIDDVKHASRRQWRESAAQVFHMYEDLPIGYVVFRLMEDGGEDDLLILYANRRFARAVRSTPFDLAGETAGRALPRMNPRHIAIARAAARDGREHCIQSASDYFPGHLAVTSSRIIGQGFCALTYLFLTPTDEEGT